VGATATWRKAELRTQIGFQRLLKSLPQRFEPKSENW
jgi:hypothetical protein